MLLKAGWEPRHVTRFIEAVARAGGDDEVEDRLKAVETTAATVEAGQQVTGVTRPTELIGDEAVARVRKWLRLGKGAGGGRSSAKRGPYVATPDGIAIEKQGEHGPDLVPLTNFTAVITADVIEDDGAEQARQIDLRCEVRRQVIELRLPASAFNGMSWPIEKLGPQAIVEPGLGTRDLARAAIQHLSDPDIPRRTVYTHTGWRKVSDGAWMYLHAGGAVGPDGPVHSVETRLDGALALFELPDPVEGEDLVTAIHASLGLLRLAPPRIAVPAYAAVWRAVLGRSAFSLFGAGLEQLLCTRSAFGAC